LKLVRYYFLLSFFFQNNSFSQSSDEGNPENVKTNLEIFEESILTQLEKYLYYPGLDRSLPFVFIVKYIQTGGGITTGESETKFTAGMVKKAAQSLSLQFSFFENPGEIKLDTNYNLVLLQVYNLETKYTGFKKNKFLGKKTIIRNIKVKIGIDISSNDKKFRLSDFILSDYKDEIGFEEHERLESTQYGFTKGELPEINFFERIIFPVFSVTASAAVIVLFFIIRTK
jgi:hypothetical protein